MVQVCTLLVMQVLTVEGNSFDVVVLATEDVLTSEDVASQITGKLLSYVILYYGFNMTTGAAIPSVFGSTLDVNNKLLPITLSNLHCLSSEGYVCNVEVMAYAVLNAVSNAVSNVVSKQKLYPVL